MRRLSLVLALACLVLPAVAAITADPTGAADMADMAEFRVMSFNIRYGTADDGDHAWPQRAACVVEVIDGFGPDLLGLQECLAFQRDELMAALPGYDVVAVGREDGAEGGEMCACFYRADRFERLDTGTFWLSDTPAVTASRGWDAALPRIATWVRLRRWEGGGDVLWLNTHFDHMGAEARRRSAALLHRWLRDHAQGAPVVVTGDFNADAADAAGGAGDVHRALVSGEPAAATPLLQDTWLARHPEIAAEDGTFNGFGRHPRPGRIDWVLVTPDLDVTRAGIVRTRCGDILPSDHFPGTAVVRPAAPGPPSTPVRR
jgi:endonuclease/exonuclease/phosphatase family metal-dependent hydrolase